MKRFKYTLLEAFSHLQNVGVRIAMKMAKEGEFLVTKEDGMVYLDGVTPVGTLAETLQEMRSAYDEIGLSYSERIWRVLGKEETFSLDEIMKEFNIGTF